MSILDTLDGSFHIQPGNTVMRTIRTILHYSRVVLFSSFFKGRIP